MSDLLQQCIDIARQAGDTIMEIYESGDFGVETKHEDGFESPLTKADTASNKVIEAGLKRISDLPIVSEESSHDSLGSGQYWLVDPIDGTKEFIKRNGEFTVNIGLIKDEEPILGVVYAPAKDVLYAGVVGEGAIKITDGNSEPITASFKGDTPVVVASRSHRDERVDEYITSLNLDEHEEISMGSSLKLCLVAEGKAIAYPRFAPTMLWDTAAADAVVRAAGGTTKDPDGNPLRYDASKEDLHNPFFIVRGIDA